MSTRTMNKKMRNTISLLEVTTRIVGSELLQEQYYIPHYRRHTN